MRGRQQHRTWTRLQTKPAIASSLYLCAGVASGCWVVPLSQIHAPHIPFLISHCYLMQALTCDGDWSQLLQLTPSDAYAATCEPPRISLLCMSICEYMHILQGWLAKRLPRQVMMTVKDTPVNR